MVAVKHPKPLDIKQESTNYNVAASKLLNLLCLIIDGVKLQSSKKAEKTRIQNTEARIQNFNNQR